MNITFFTENEKNKLALAAALAELKHLKQAHTENQDLIYQGRPYVPKDKLEQARKACAEMRDMIGYLLRYPSEGFKAVALLRRSDCGRDFVPKSELDQAQAALAWVGKLLDRITRHEALTEDVRAEAQTWLLSPVLIEASKRFVPKVELDAAKAQLKAWESNATHSINMGIAMGTEKLKSEAERLQKALEICKSELERLLGVVSTSDIESISGVLEEAALKEE